jgi:hypothetical protein
MSASPTGADTVTITQAQALAQGYTPADAQAATDS